MGTTLRSGTARMAADGRKVDSGGQGRQVEASRVRLGGAHGDTGQQSATGGAGSPDGRAGSCRFFITSPC
jgi:hypothetical protein